MSQPWVKAFTHKFGTKAATDPFGAPSFVAAEMIAIAISNTCAKGTTSRAAVTKALKATSIPTSILGHAVAFDNVGDVKKGPARGITVFQIQADGTYKPVFAG